MTSAPKQGMEDYAAADSSVSLSNVVDAVASTPASESVLYVNDARYARLSALMDDARRGSDVDVGIAAPDDVSLHLFREARMLDDRRFEEWLSLFAPECIYWVPSRFDPGDPRVETSIYLDDRRRMGDRVAAIRTGYLHAQIPPSRTRRMLSNIEQWAAKDGSLRARANVVIWEHRKGETRAHPGWQVYEIVHDDRGALSIATKIVCLLDCDGPQGNYSFIL